MQKTRSVPKLLRNSISARLLRIVFFFYIVIAIIITITHMLIEFRQTQKDILNELNMVHKTFEPGLATALWEVNQLQVKSTIEGMTNLPVVGKVIIKEAIDSQNSPSKGLQITASKPNHPSSGTDGNQIFVTNGISFIDNSSKTTLEVGQLTIFATKSAAINRVKLGFIIIIISAAIKSLALWIIFLWFSRSLISAPLQNLIGTIHDLDFDNEKEVNFDIGVKGNNELSFLQLAFKNMTIRLKKSRKSLKEHNLLLEEKVKDRTKKLECTNKELRSVNQRLEKISTTDPLTKMNNRRYLDTHLPPDIAMSIRNYNDWLETDPDTLPPVNELMFYFIDIDHFKNINDTYGHDSGDMILVQFSEILKKVFRKSDYMIRWGGEEFLMVARFVKPDSLTTVAERIRKLVEEHSFSISSNRTALCTCSIGFASFPFDIRHPEEITWCQVIKIADKALYAAKASGRNCWVGLSKKAEYEGTIKFANILNGSALENVNVLASINNSADIKWL